MVREDKYMLAKPVRQYSGPWWSGCPEMYLALPPSRGRQESCSHFVKRDPDHDHRWLHQGGHESLVLSRRCGLGNGPVEDLLWDLGAAKGGDVPIQMEGSQQRKEEQGWETEGILPLCHLWCSTFWGPTAPCPWVDWDLLCSCNRAQILVLAWSELTSVISRGRQQASFAFRCSRKEANFTVPTEAQREQPHH